jgi:hypothetical protein
MKSDKDKIEKLEWEIDCLREQLMSQKRAFDYLHRSKQVNQIVCREGKHFRALQILETWPTKEGTKILVQK